MTVTKSKVATLSRHSPEEARRVISLFDQGCDPKTVAQKLGFASHVELGQFMKLNGYVWSASGNYVCARGTSERRDTEIEGSRDSAQREGDDGRSASPSAETLETGGESSPVELGDYLPLLEWLAEHQGELRQLLEGGPGAIPRYTIPGHVGTKTVHIVHELAALVVSFSKEFNISQREVFEVALVDFFRKYGYGQEVDQLLGV